MASAPPELELRLTATDADAASRSSSELLLVLPLLAAVALLARAIAGLQPSDGTRSGDAQAEPLLPRGSASTSASATPSGQRLASLDVFRGATLCLMVFVNYGGGVFERFRWSFGCLLGCN